MATQIQHGKGKEKESQVGANVQEALSKSEQFIEQNQKLILTIVGAVALIVCAVLAFRNFYLQPREREAEAQIFKAESWFAKDSFRLALNGNEDFIGFEDIADQYGMTKTANLTKAYIGLCYKNLGNYDEALKNLKDFDANDKLISPAIIISIGDCYVELGKVKEGIDCFLKAASKADNDLISPFALKKAGIAYESLNQYDKAVNVYKQIKDNYFTSNEGYTIDKHIERAKALGAVKQ